MSISDVASKPDDSAYVMTDPILEVRGLKKHYTVGKQVVRALDGIDLTIGRGEIVGLVGESGSGKSTMGKCIANLTKPTSGSIRLNGVEIASASRRQMRPMRQVVQMVFQDPYSSLNPRMTIGDIVMEPLRQQKTGRKEMERRAGEIMERCGLRRSMSTRYPHELSGGQRQRVGLARALAIGPGLLIADEPVSALDVSVQASILNLILDLQSEMGFSCLFITHDLSVVEFISDRLAVMYLGKVAEIGPRDSLFADPQHPYTQSLLSAAPVPDPDPQRHRQRIVLRGELPNPADPPSGCTFRTRCPIAEDICSAKVPALLDRKTHGQGVSCHFVTPDSSPNVAGPQRVESQH